MPPLCIVILSTAKDLISMRRSFAVLRMTVLTNRHSGPDPESPGYSMLKSLLLYF